MCLVRKLTCPECGATFEKRSWNNTAPLLCSVACRLKRRAERKRTLVTSCKRCLGTVVLRGNTTRPPYCSEECRVAAVREVSSRTMASTNGKYASARMKANNPMHRGCAEVVSATLRRMGHKPPVRGGNGRPAPEPQRLLAEALGWPMEVVVPTRIPRGAGWPVHYKLDVASREHMVAVEVDGSSHCALDRRAQDARKDEFLRGLGWTVLRFTNQEVMASLEACVRTVMSTTSKSRGSTTTLRAAS